MFHQFFDQISYMKYGYVGLTINEYTGLKYKCGTRAAPLDGPGDVCPTSNELTGEATMKRFGYDRYTISYCAGCLIAYIIVCRTASYLALRFWKM